MQPIQEIGGVEKPCKALGAAFAAKPGQHRRAVTARRTLPAFMPEYRIWMKLISLC